MRSSAYFRFVRMLRVFLILFLVGVVALFYPGKKHSLPKASAAQLIGEAPLVGFPEDLDDEDPKNPDVEISNGKVYVSWGTDKDGNNGKARLAEKYFWGGPFTRVDVGKIQGESTYFTTSIAADANGTLHYVWIENERTIKHRSRNLGGGWSEEHIVNSKQKFPSSISLAASQNDLFAAWRGPEGELQIAHSIDAGISWNTTQIGPKAYRGTPTFAVHGKDVYLAWTSSDFFIYLAKWNGTSFDAKKLFPDKIFGEPEIGELPDSRLVMLSRINANPFYAEQQGDASWTRSDFFTAGGSTPQPALAVDTDGNVHIAFVGNFEGRRQVLYAIKRVGEDTFSDPVAVSKDDNNYKVNVSIDAESFGSMARAYVAWETFYFENSTDEWPKHKIRAIS